MRLLILASAVLVAAASTYYEGTDEAEAFLSRLELSPEVTGRALEKYRRFQRADKEEFRSHGTEAGQSRLRHHSQGARAGLGKPTGEALAKGRRALLLEIVTKELQEDGRGTTPNRSPFLRLMSRLVARSASERHQRFHLAVQPRETCPEEEAEDAASCDPRSPYRTVSGRCNNLASPDLGRHTRRLLRMLEPEYDDGVARPRIRSAERGGVLPNVRSVSTAAHQSEFSSATMDERHTLMLMQFGQFLDHDITLTPMFRGVNGSILDCSGCDSNGRHPACYPILVPKGDKHFPIRKMGARERTCIPFTRSLPGQDEMGPRHQINQVTAYLDASNLYGSTPCRASSLRAFSGGRLRNASHPSSRVFKPLMPTKRAGDAEECRSRRGVCFDAGDERGNEHPGLAITHTAFLRQHNRVADKLAAANPQWDDERTFQEARKIMAALSQHITYNEFLPRVLGQKVMRTFGLELAPAGEHSHDYDPDCASDISNEFATAAFRFGHSLIHPSFSMMTRKMERVPAADVRLKRHFNNPDVVFESGSVDGMLRGLALAPMEKYDGVITKDVTNHLFEERDEPFSGLDLAALNLQRGREHGIPGYTKYVGLCFPELRRVASFRDLRPLMKEESIKKLQSVYRHVDDIELFSGGLSERPVPGGVVGPTFACIIGEQFGRIKKCDRFWYEREGPEGFTPDQLEELRKITLASIVCNNCDQPSPIQKRVFDLVDESANPLIPCEEHHSLDISPWAESGVQEESSTREGKSDGATFDKNVEKKAKAHYYCEVRGRVLPVGASGVRVSACQTCDCSAGRVADAACATVKVSDCDALEEEVGADAVRADDACASQCTQLV